MLIIKAFHIIAMVTWFAGLFYLPRLFVYHTQSKDKISIDRFQTMEFRLYYAIMCPAGVMTTGLGLWLFGNDPSYYSHVGWMQAKLILVVFLWIYHAYCGFCVKRFAQRNNRHSTKFYRIFNEIPTLLLIVIVILAVVKP
ncbi:MAG: protoporphyrinogen oxidase HemJ [Gammaproteobacteria bacterium]